jgi:lipopolysaccharide transport protein LptA|tara:strand:+ start:307 stop:756 length:450 start_codon:yes stop_codon:yes gene_type:complete
MKKVYLIILILITSHTLSAEEDISYLEIASDKLIITENPLVSEFIGNVYAKNEDNQIWGNTILVNYDNDKKINLITAVGNVIVERQEEKIIGDKAVYNLKSEKIIISGDVSVFRDGNILNGSELTMDLITSISIIKGSNKKQVSAKVIE